MAVIRSDFNIEEQAECYFRAFLIWQKQFLSEIRVSYILNLFCIFCMISHFLVVREDIFLMYSVEEGKNKTNLKIRHSY